METTLCNTKELVSRPRRNRVSSAIRSLVQETRLHPSDFVVPLFILEGNGKREEIKSMPGVYRLSIDLMLREVEQLVLMGIQAVDVFVVCPSERKDSQGSEALREENLLQQSVQALKSHFPKLCVMVDIALDPFTDHGHDGLVNRNGVIMNDETVTILEQMALLAAAAGADIVAPSDMMDGRVKGIRTALDRHGYHEVGICAYTAKYASALYGPFREALHSAPKFGDKKTYQMNPANVKEALRECALDEAEGADMLMVKPASLYLDVIAKMREESTLPICAYHVSGEYSMVMAAGERGWLDPDKVFYETLLSIKRAGADFIFTYAASRVIPMLS